MSMELRRRLRRWAVLLYRSREELKRVFVYIRLRGFSWLFVLFLFSCLIYCLFFFFLYLTTIPMFFFFRGCAKLFFTMYIHYVYIECSLGNLCLDVSVFCVLALNDGQCSKFQ